MKSAVYKFVRFGLVGVSGFTIDFSVTWLMLSVLGVFEYGANAIGFTLAATSNYILNRMWTWKSNNPNIRGEFVKFFAVSLIGLCINSFIIWLVQLYITDEMVSAFCGHQLDVFWVAKLIATGVVLMWNFLVNNYFTFRHR